MNKTILLTGAADGIGLEAARMLAAQGHTLLLHGRNAAKLAEVQALLSALPGAGRIESFVTDLSRLSEVETLAGAGRVINLSSAAQAPVDLDALAGRGRLDDMAAYAQSKLALTMWSRHMALTLVGRGPAIVAVNPGSMLGSKMVKEAFGVPGGDIRIGADILTRAALTDEFATASGKYYDNDAKRFAPPHPDALDAGKSDALVGVIEKVLHAAKAGGGQPETTQRKGVSP